MLAMRLILGWAVASAMVAQAAQVTIQSYDAAGKLTFNEVTGASGYRVEWAARPQGPWTNFAGAAAWLDNLPHTGSGTVTCAVPMVYRVLALVSNVAPADMVLIPTGSFIMGNATNVFPASEGYSEELPQHTLSISAIYICTNEVTKAQWDEVYAWAVTHGYQFDNPGSGKGADHPVQTVNWFDAVKWCNARSQKEGLAPCYTTNGGVYRTGAAAPDCQWTVRGYRLPTEAEWERAARGGAPSRRFPWSATNDIQHARANYYSTIDFAYDTSPTRGYHPAYGSGGLPYTSPAGALAANGYGLCDMAGNVWEWCWDWYDGTYYSASPAADPRGPVSSPESSRTVRGGSWSDDADGCRTAYRNNRYPDYEDYYIGFRVVLPQGL